MVKEVRISMARVCPVTGKAPISGNARSHSLIATRRRWNVNLQPVKVNLNGRVVTMKLSARAIKTLRKSNRKAAAKTAA
jgi:large subunit ribosomal protein L28